MEELRNILLEHAKRYPMMEPTDGVKLIYQNEFGGGHLIRDEQGCRNYLLREYEATAKSEACPVFESIGNGLVRVHLSAVKRDQLEPLASAFILGAAAHSGDHDRFLGKLEILKELSSQGVFSFGPNELQEYLARYMEAGCPAVSHSLGYRRQYHPAYRVIRRCDLECLL